MLVEGKISHNFLLGLSVFIQDGDCSSKAKLILLYKQSVNVFKIYPKFNLMRMFIWQAA